MIGVQGSVGDDLWRGNEGFGEPGLPGLKTLKTRRPASQVSVVWPTGSIEWSQWGLTGD